MSIYYPDDIKKNGIKEHKRVMESLNGVRSIRMNHAVVFTICEMVFFSTPNEGISFRRMEQSLCQSALKQFWSI